MLPTTGTCRAIVRFIPFPCPSPQPLRQTVAADRTRRANVCCQRHRIPDRGERVGRALRIGPRRVMPPDAASSTGARRQRLVQRRKALGLTQEELAEQVGVGRSTMVRWERGESEPLPSIRARLARALKVSAEVLESLLAADDGRGDGAVPRQLPAAVADFTGRAAELQRLTQVLDAAGASGPG